MEDLSLLQVYWLLSPDSQAPVAAVVSLMYAFRSFDAEIPWQGQSMEMLDSKCLSVWMTPLVSFCGAAAGKRSGLVAQQQKQKLR